MNEGDLKGEVKGMAENPQTMATLSKLEAIFAYFAPGFFILLWMYKGFIDMSPLVQIFSGFAISLSYFLIVNRLYSRGYLKEKIKEKALENKDDPEYVSAIHYCTLIHNVFFSITLMVVIFINPHITSIISSSGYSLPEISREVIILALMAISPFIYLEIKNNANS